MPIRERDGQVPIREPKRTYDTQAGGAPTLEVRTLKRFWAFPYTHFLNSCLNLSGNLEINFVSYQIFVSGRNLHILHQLLTLMSLKMIEPTDKAIPISDEQDVEIETIDVFSASASQEA